MNENLFPPGWNTERVASILKHYELQTEDEALAEDEAAFEDETLTLMEHGLTQMGRIPSNKSL